MDQGKEHVRKHQNPLAGVTSSTSVLPEIAPLSIQTKLTHVMGSQICGQCHSSFDSYEPLSSRAKMSTKQGQFVRHADAQDPASPFFDNYWNDGSIRIGGREYLGSTESPCYQRGKMSCMSCHSMHKSDPNDQLAQRGMEYQSSLPAMPPGNGRPDHGTYLSSRELGRKPMLQLPYAPYFLCLARCAIRNHRISSPKCGKPSVQSGHPNACNLCHLDKTLQWTSEHLTDWYDQPPVELNASQQDDCGVGLQMLLKWRCSPTHRDRLAHGLGTGAWKLPEKTGNRHCSPSVLQDPYSAVRFVAQQESMQETPPL